MSDLAIIMVCLTVIVITAIISTTWYSLHKVDPVEEARQRLRDAEDSVVRSLEREAREQKAARRLFPVSMEPTRQEMQEMPQVMSPWLEDEPPHEPDSSPYDPGSMAPIPVDHDNPPKPLVYRRKGTAPIPNCTCHGRPLHEGQEILWWPVPDSTVVKIFCQRENS